MSSRNPGRHRVDINSVLNASRLFSGMNTFFLDEQIANGVEFPSLNFPVYCFTDLKFVSLFSYIYIVPLSASLNSETRYTIMISKESDNFGKSSINVSNDSTAT